jgi:hypothetical protein
MKKVVLFIWIVIGWSSCGIDEQQPKPDYTKTGKQMFDNTEDHIRMVTDWLDIMLKLNTYIQAADTDKITVEDSFFSEYKIRKSSLNTWSLIHLRDTTYQIIVDGSSFTTSGATWKIKTKNMLTPCVFSCVNSSNWLLNVTDFAIDKLTNNEFYYPYSTRRTTHITDSLNFNSESTHPQCYKAYNFKVSGKGEFLQLNNCQKIQFSYLITQDLKHVTDSYYNINSGKYSLSAVDLSNFRLATSTAEFETLMGDVRKITIVYEGRTQVYPNDNH